VPKKSTKYNETLAFDFSDNESEIQPALKEEIQKKPLSVTELNNLIKDLLERGFPYVIVTGEISNSKLHTQSGHLYFTLKDENSQIQCVMWNTRVVYLKFKPENGLKVIIEGRITVYKGRGTYQIDVLKMIPEGKGELQLAFEQLKEKLEKEGLFDESRKKPLPEFPCRVGVITSETGAAIEDFKNVSRKRYPLFTLVLFPALMQGEGSAESVCRAVALANKKKFNIDVIVITRGGGSVEDLWTFNEESVARAVFESKIPVLSAIGHEIDFTICDFTADKRAPTPSAAAEILLPDKSELLESIDNFNYNIKIYIKRRIENLKNELKNFEKNYFFNKPKDILNELKFKLDDFENNLSELIRERMYMLKNQLNTYDKILFNISPDQTLKRGFAYVTKNSGIISRSAELMKDDNVKIKFYDGEKKAVIK